jgi:hypothetical protein
MALAANPMKTDRGMSRKSSIKMIHPPAIGMACDLKAYFSYQTSAGMSLTREIILCMRQKKL